MLEFSVALIFALSVLRCLFCAVSCSSGADQVAGDIDAKMGAASGADFQPFTVLIGAVPAVLSKHR